MTTLQQTTLQQTTLQQNLQSRLFGSSNPPSRLFDISNLQQRLCLLLPFGGKQYITMLNSPVVERVERVRDGDPGHGLRNCLRSVPIPRATPAQLHKVLTNVVP
jgi:hypothetical protein